MDFKIFLPVDYDIKDVYNDNIDINVILPTNKVYFGTLFTIANIRALMEKDEKVSFGSTDMVIVNDLGRSTIHQAIQELIGSDYLSEAFSEIGNVSEIFSAYKNFEDIPYVAMKIA